MGEHYTIEEIIDEVPDDELPTLLTEETAKRIAAQVCYTTRDTVVRVDFTLDTRSRLYNIILCEVLLRGLGVNAYSARVEIIVGRFRELLVENSVYGRTRDAG